VIEAATWVKYWITSNKIVNEFRVEWGVKLYSLTHSIKKRFIAAFQVAKAN